MVPNGSNYEKLIQTLNEQDLQTGYNAPPMFVALDGTSFVVKMSGSDEPLAKLDHMEVQIIYAKKTRAMYDPDKSAKGTLCRSADGNIHGNPRIETFSRMTYLANFLMEAKQMQFAPIENPQLCRSCIFDQWGTRLKLDNGSLSAEQGRACGERKLIVFIHPDFSRPLTMSLSLSSAKKFDIYASSFLSRKPATNYRMFKTLMKASTERSTRDATQKYEVVNFSRVGEQLPPALVMSAADLAVPYMAEGTTAELLENEPVAGNSGSVPQAPADDFSF